MWARSVQPFGRLLDTNKKEAQTDKQSIYIDIDIDFPVR